MYEWANPNPYIRQFVTSLNLRTTLPARAPSAPDLNRAGLSCTVPPLPAAEPARDQVDGSRPSYRTARAAAAPPPYRQTASPAYGRMRLARRRAAGARARRTVFPSRRAP